MNVKIKKLKEGAVVPKKVYDKDFCYDVVAVSEEEIAPNVWKYGLGFALERIPNFDEDDDCGIRCSFDIRPRSSVWKTGMILSNCEGTVDDLYRGEVSMVFYHVFPNMPRYKVGDRIGQLKLGVTDTLEFIEVDELSESERGDGGYGSTGR